MTYHWNITLDHPHLKSIEEPIENLEEYGVETRWWTLDGPETMIALRSIARNSGSFALILLWSLLKITSSGGWSEPPENIVVGPSQPLGSQTLLHLLACLIQTYEWFL